MARIGQSIVAEFVKMGVQKLAHWVATELGMTAATTAGAAARSAANTSESTGFLSTIGGMLAKWFSLETAKTAATEGEAAVRTGLNIAEAAAGRVAAVTAGFSQIAIDAAVAAAGAFAATAAIPIVGPELAPAAAAAYAATMGWAAGLGGGVAAAAGGWVVPDDQLAFVHKNEMVLPANISQGLQGAISGGGFGGGPVVHNWNVTAVDAAGVAKFFKSNAPALVAALNYGTRNGSALRNS
jgi:hypothetical protein